MNGNLNEAAVNRLTHPSVSAINLSNFCNITPNYQSHLAHNQKLFLAIGLNNQLQAIPKRGGIFYTGKGKNRPTVSGKQGGKGATGMTQGQGEENRAELSDCCKECGKVVDACKSLVKEGFLSKTECDGKIDDCNKGCNPKCQPAFTRMVR